MTEPQLHVVFGAGQVGRVLVAHLARQGKDVRVVCRHRRQELPDGADSRDADAEAAADAAKGAYYLRSRSRSVRSCCGLIVGSTSRGTGQSVGLSSLGRLCWA
jgi:NAD(P)-dependent dehydrogenase (short-subunit alcohol dehydrogenase family)